VNDALMQFQADLLRVPVIRPRTTETTALGAAYLAGLAAGFWRDRDEIAALWQAQRRFRPAASAARMRALQRDWTRAVARARGWAAT
jgi:glycerol kinase